MTAKEQKAQAVLADIRSQMSQQLVPKEKQDNTEVVNRPTALDFKKTEKLKELILQDIKKGRTQSFTQYTKSLVKQYLQNPASYRHQIIGVSRFLWRVSTLYKKIIMYYATMPLYNYNIVQRVDFAKSPDVNKMIKQYEKVLKTTHCFNFRDNFATAIALALRDGCYCGFMYDFGEDGSFLHMLPVEYYKIRGKNEAGQWVVAFDLTYFTVGQNVIFVEGINGDTSGCWHQCFCDAWNEYKNSSNKQDSRWFIIPPEYTITLLGNIGEDEFENPLPFYTGLMTPILDELDLENIVSEKTELENFYLLLLQIDTFDGNSETVDDFKVSLEIAEAYKNAIADIMPSLAGVGLLPGMKADLQTFSKANSQTDESVIAEAMNTIFSQAGANQLVVSSGNSTSNYAIKMSISNDLAFTSLLLSRLESNYQYYIDNNIADGTIFSIHRQTYYNDDEYLEKIKTSATLGGPAMRYLTAQGMTPYEAYCSIVFESAIGLKSMMEPLESSYQMTKDDNEVGRPTTDPAELSGSGQRTRDADTIIAE